MDTRFWGPSGWKLLHMISFNYEYSVENSYAFANFFETIPFILPCKFCRSSLTDFYKKYPYRLEDNNGKEGTMNPLLDVKKWMYNIHNCVNGKLRAQGLYPSSNPTYATCHRWRETYVLDVALVPQITIVRPPAPEFPHFLDCLPIFPSRWPGVLRSWRPPDGRCRSSGTVEQTCG